MDRLRKVTGRAGERGQALLMIAAMLPVLLGMTGLAVDVATYAGDRRALQNAADSIALAASKELPDYDATMATANSWAAKNEIDPADMTVLITGGTTAPKVRVEIARSHNFFFMKALGVSQRDIGASAGAVKVSFGGGAGVVPWSVLETTVDAAGDGELVTLKYDSNDVSVGNFGVISIDGEGSSVYNNSASYGSTTVVCADSTDDCDTTACPGTYPDVCAETAPSCDGPDCNPETGNMVGGTRSAVDHRMAYTSSSCDTFEETFGTGDASGKYHLNPDCNPWIDGPGKCTSTTSLCSRRVIIIPVIDEFGSGSSDPTKIVKFALLYLEGYASDKCQGNSCEIQGRFVRADLTTNALAGVYDENASIQFTRLSE